MRSYSFADLFAGCGGLSLGLSLAGLKGRFAIERDEMAFRTFACNFIERNGPAGQFNWPTWLEQKAWDVEE
ncbi:DNA cytosine methyltransferase, partial [Mesorhizobium sp. M2A.F.Ca.ET.039.01.1.1]